ncbi:hypothetical protein Unana1_08327 [Umbelopsis nana]
MSSIHTIENRPFLTFLSGILDSHYFSKGHSSPLRILEVGCGVGHFARIISSNYGSKVTVIGLDANEAVIAKAKELSAGLVEGSVTFLQAEFNKFTDTELFDVIVFTKSFHHCLPIDEAAKNAQKLLKTNGLIVAEELVRDKPPTSTMRWFFDRFDPLVASNIIDPTKEVIYDQKPGGQQHPHSHDGHHHGHQHDQHQQGGHQHGGHQNGGHQHDGSTFVDRMKRFSDSTLDPMERYNVFYNTTIGLPFKQEIIDSIQKVFGLANTRVIDTLPFLYHHLVFCGLNDDEAGRQAIASFIVEEERAVQAGEIPAIGMNIVAEKVE